MRLALALSLLAVVAGAQPAPQPGEDSRKCVVEGVVTNQLTGEPIRQVEIGLLPVRERAPGQRPPAAIGVYTDSSGKFRIDSLEPGVYRVQIRKEGFTFPPGSGAYALPKLAPGQELRDVSLSLVPQAVLSGRVLDDNGDPVHGAMLQLLRQRTVRGVPSFSFSTGAGFATTDDRGEFRMAGVNPGRYLLAVDHMESREILYPLPGGGATAYVATYFPGVSDQAQAQPVEIQAGSVQTGLEIRLRREPVFRVRGRALDAEGNPLRRFVLSISEPMSGFFGWRPGLNEAFSNGDFTLQGVRPGAWVITARSIESGMPPGSNASAEITVGSADLDGVILRAAPMQQVAGLAVLEDAGDAKPDWRQVGVLLMPSEGRIAASSSGSLSPDGAFTIQFSGGGKAFFNIAGVPVPGTYLAAIRSGSDDYLQRDVDLTAGFPGPVRLVFRGGAACLTGRVESADPNLLAARPSVLLWPADPSRRELRPAASGEVKPDGSFTVADLRPGEYVVYPSMELAGSPYGPAELPADLDARGLRVRLDRGATRNVTVSLPAPQGR
ncbi:MAG: carboxypeptidase regulatory-like domain-containing protein [Candidatus Solibacter usitatus]|nr:carboxypeptidase regulatory-like domain-containing protein [Candidatus Solibacter usitatus]